MDPPRWMASPPKVNRWRYKVCTFCIMPYPWKWHRRHGNAGHPQGRIICPRIWRMACKTRATAYVEAPQDFPEGEVSIEASTRKCSKSIRIWHDSRCKRQCIQQNDGWSLWCVPGQLQCWPHQTTKTTNNLRATNTQYVQVIQLHQQQLVMI